MLSRVANNIYWMGRYLERACSMARIIQMNIQLMLDMPDDERNQWEPLVRITGDHDFFIETYPNVTKQHVMQFLTFDRTYPNSIISSLMAARENARVVRENISWDLWHSINHCYLRVLQDDSSGSGIGSQDLYHDINESGRQIEGAIHDTLLRSDGYHFIRLGQMLERADKASRLLDIKYFSILPGVEFVGTPLDELQWTALLRASSALESYRRRYGPVTQGGVVDLMLLNTSFPRSVSYALHAANDRLHALSGSRQSSYENPAEQKLGRICAELRYNSSEEVIAAGLHEYLDHLQTRINAVGDAIHTVYFEYTQSNQKERQ